MRRSAPARISHPDSCGSGVSAPHVLRRASAAARPCDRSSGPGRGSRAEGKADPAAPTLAGRRKGSNAAIGPRDRPGAKLGARCRRAAAVAVASALAACKVGPGYNSPETHVPGALGASVRDGAKATPPVARWWTTFKDPVLDGLVTRAVRGNPDLRGAEARVREA